MAQVRDTMLLEIGDVLNKLNTVDQRMNKVMDKPRIIKASVKVDEGAAAINRELKSISPNLTALTVRLRLKQTDVQDAFKDVKNYVQDIGKMDLSALIRLRDQLKKHLEEMGKRISELRALGGTGSGSGGGGPGSGAGRANSGASAANRALLNELERVNNAFQRGDMSAGAYDQALMQLQSRLRSAAATATQGSNEFRALDRAITGTSRGLSQVNAGGLQQLRNELGAASLAFREASANAQSLADRRVATATYRAELERLKVSLQGMVASGQLTGRQLAQVQAQLGRIATESERLQRANLGGLFQNIGNGAQQLLSYIPGFGQFAGFFDAMPAKVMATAAAFAILTAGLAASFRTAAQFQAVMVDINALTSPTADSLAQLGEAATSYEHLGIGATEAAKAALALNKAGLETADVVGGGMAGALNLAGAAGASAAQGGEMVVTAMTAFGLTAKDLPGIADTYANFANKTTQSAEGLSLALAAVGPVAKSAGLNFDEFAGYMATLSQGGFASMQDGATSLKTMLLSLQAPTGASLKAIKDLRLEVYDAAGGMRPLGDILDDLRGKLAGMNEQERNSNLRNLFGTDGIRAATILMGDFSKSQIETKLRIEENIKAMGLQGEAARVAAERMESYAGHVKQLNATWENFKAAVGEKFLPAATAVVKQLAQMVDGAEDMMNTWETLVGYIGPVGIALGVVKYNAIAAGAAATWAGLMGALTKIPTLITAITAAMATNPFGAIAAAAAGLATYTNYILTDIRKINEETADADNEAFQGLMDRVNELTSTGDELDRLKARYLLAVEAMGEAQMGEITGVDFWGNINREVNEEDLERKRQAVADLRGEIRAMSAEREGAESDTPLGGPLFSPEAIQQQAEAVASLRQELDGRALKLQLDGKEGIERELFELGDTFTKLREQVKKPFYLPDGTLGMTPELEKALAELDYQYSVETTATIEKALDAQGKLRLEKEREIQGMRLDLMRDGQGKLHAQAAAEIDAMTDMYDEAIAEAVTNRDAEGQSPRQRERWNNEVLALEGQKAEGIKLINQQLHRDLEDLDREQLDRLKSAYREVLSAQANMAASMTTLLEGQRDRALDLAEESAGERLSIERSFAPQFAQLARDQQRLAGEARRAELAAQLESDLRTSEEMGDRAGAAATAARQKYSAELRALELSEQAERASAAAASEKRIRDAEKAVLQERADEYQKMLDKRLRNLNKATGLELATMARLLQADLARAQAQGNQAAVKVISSGLEKVMEQATENAEEFRDALKESSKQTGDLRRQLSELGFSDAEKAVADASNPYTSVINSTREQLEELRKGFAAVVAPDPQMLAAYRQREAELTQIMNQASTERTRAAAKAEAEYWRVRNDEAQQSSQELARRELDYGRITMQAYRDVLVAARQYWKEREASATGDDLKAVQEQLRANEDEFRRWAQERRSLSKDRAAFVREELAAQLEAAATEEDRGRIRQQLRAFDQATLSFLDGEIAKLEAQGGHERELLDLKRERLGIQQGLRQAQEAEVEAQQQLVDSQLSLRQAEAQLAEKVARSDEEVARARQASLDTAVQGLAALDRRIADADTETERNQLLAERQNRLGEIADLERIIAQAPVAALERQLSLTQALREQDQVRRGLAEDGVAQAEAALQAAQEQVTLAQATYDVADGQAAQQEALTALIQAQTGELRAQQAVQEALNEQLTTRTRLEADLGAATTRANLARSRFFDDPVALARLNLEAVRVKQTLNGMEAAGADTAEKRLEVEAERQNLLAEEAEAQRALIAAERQRLEVARSLRDALQGLRAAAQGRGQGSETNAAVTATAESLTRLREAEADAAGFLAQQQRGEALSWSEAQEGKERVEALTGAIEDYRGKLLAVADAYERQLGSMDALVDAALQLNDVAGSDPAALVFAAQVGEIQRQQALKETARLLNNQQATYEQIAGAAGRLAEAEQGRLVVQRSALEGMADAVQNGGDDWGLKNELLGMGYAFDEVDRLLQKVRDEGGSALSGVYLRMSEQAADRLDTLRRRALRAISDADELRAQAFATRLEAAQEMAEYAQVADAVKLEDAGFSSLEAEQLAAMDRQERLNRLMTQTSALAPAAISRQDAAATAEREREALALQAARRRGLEDINKVTRQDIEDQRRLNAVAEEYLALQDTRAQQLADPEGKLGYNAGAAEVKAAIALQKALDDAVFADGERLKRQTEYWAKVISEGVRLGLKDGFSVAQPLDGKAVQEELNRVRFPDLTEQGRAVGMTTGEAIRNAIQAALAEPVRVRVDPYLRAGAAGAGAATANRSVTNNWTLGGISLTVEHHGEGEMDVRRLADQLVPELQRRMDQFGDPCE